MPHRNPATRPMFLFLAVLTFGQAASFFGWTALYTNFAVEVAGFTGQQNGYVQSIREVPGLLGVGVLFFLLFMREARLAACATILCGIGVICSGFFPRLGGQLFWVLMLSTGFHFFEVNNQSLTLQYFSVSDAPLIIGRLRSITGAANFCMGLLILGLASFLPYTSLFCIAGTCALGAGLWGFFKRPERAGLPPQRRNMVMRRKYWLFYCLTFLAGARRQIFLVFTVFLLVERFKFSLMDMSLLFLCNNLINWMLNPFIGKAINTFGERLLLTAKYLIIIVLCIAYVYCAYAWLAAALYIVDQVLFNFTISIRTFFQKIADASDIGPSMAVGVTVNHIAAVVVPLVGGALWMVDYRIPFWLGLGFAVTSLIMARFIRLPASDAVKREAAAGA